MQHHGIVISNFKMYVPGQHPRLISVGASYTLCIIDEQSSCFTHELKPMCMALTSNTKILMECKKQSLPHISSEQHAGPNQSQSSCTQPYTSRLMCKRSICSIV